MAIKEDMESILTNLVENSLKYSSSRNIIVEIGQQSSEYYFKICNNIGKINEEIKDNLFDPFIKCNNNNREISSSGLGLYICKRLCEKNNFKIQYFIEKNVIEFIVYFEKHRL